MTSQDTILSLRKDNRVERSVIIIGYMRFFGPFGALRNGQRLSSITKCLQRSGTSLLNYLYFFFFKYLFILTNP